MGYYTIIGFLESLMKLLIAILCTYSDSDRLILYGICMASMPIITLTIMRIYCHKKYLECTLSPMKYFDKSILRNIASFSGWNFLTAISNMVTTQGGGLILNHFFGSILNAAQGISNQVNSQLANFSSNMMKALNPVITKKSANKDIELMNLYSLSGCKYSCLLFLLFAIPISLNINFILTLWLKNVPYWTSSFCVMQLFNTFLCISTGAISTSIYATGKIKHYAIYKSVTNLLPIIISYFAFKIGGNPNWLYWPIIVFIGIFGNIVILIFAKEQCSLSITNYFEQVIKPTTLTIIIMLLLGFPIKYIVLSDLLVLFFSTIATTLGFLISINYFGMSSKEKEILISEVKNWKKKFKR